MKKKLAFLCCLIFAFVMIENYVFGTTYYQAHIAVICENEEKAQELINSLCYKKSELVYPLDSRFTEEENTDIEKSNNSTVICDREFDINYHVKFYCMKSGAIDRKIISKCSGAIILYDISNDALRPIVESRSFYSDDLKRLISELYDVPLVRDMVDLQYDKGCFGILWSWLSSKYWYNAITFVTYNRGNLGLESYERRHAKLNTFTCELEKYYDVDNKWNRGHPDLSDNPASCTKTLYWIAGQAKRSIMSGFVKGVYKEPSEKMPIVSVIE